ncbi:NUDIX hydrolase [Streptomyces macrosporus]|uniref:NUDIX hydrolase n=1 Tax=Streptomyces macrosporus TaxID=44032 RepID=UPI0031CE560C
MTTTADLWHHYGRIRAERDRVVPETFHWIWSQDGGPGPELLGDLSGRIVCDLGAGAARHAAHLATRHAPARVVAADGIARHVVGAVITDAEGRVLLLHRPADDHLGGLWELPSGGVDDGETLVEALRREVGEETGLEVTAVGAYLGHFDYRSRSGRPTRQFTFTAATTGGPVVPTEHDAYAWADRAEQERVSDEVRGILAAWWDRAA